METRLEEYITSVRESLNSRRQKEHGGFLIPTSAPAGYPEVLGVVIPLQLGGCPQSA